MTPTRRASGASAYTVPCTNEWNGHDGNWSTFLIGIGSPPQNFRVLPSTPGYQVWVPLPEACVQNGGEYCANLRGVEPFEGTVSLGFVTDKSTTWSQKGLYDIPLEEHLGYSGNGLYGNDTIHIGGSQANNNLTIEQQVVVGITSNDYNMGVLGVGITPTSFTNTGSPVKSLFESLFEESLIPSWTYSYTAGAHYRDQGVPGSLIFGGYDQSRFEWPGFNFTLNPTSGLTVGVQSISTSGSLQGTGIYSLALKGHYSPIDSTVSQLWLPEEVCKSFESHFGLMYDVDNNFYLVNDTTHLELLHRKPEITFTLGVSTSVGSEGSVSITLPYTAFDLQLGWPYRNKTNYFPLRRAANDTQYVLGRTLLQEAYLVVDYERNKFSIAPAKFSNPMPRPTVVEINSPSTHPHSSTLSTGGMVAIIIVMTILALALLLCLFCIRRRRTRRNKQQIQVPFEQPKAPEICLPLQELASDSRVELFQDSNKVMVETLPHELDGDLEHKAGHHATRESAVYELPETQVLHRSGSRNNVEESRM